MNSYNSQYPLEYYEIGTPYMFYLSTGVKHGVVAPMELIKRYGSILKKTAGQKGAGYCFANRVIGVVVGKDIVNPRTGIGAIEVLFQGVSEGNTVYMTTKYITGHTGVFCDDKEQYSAAGVVNLTGEINVTVAGGQGGGIALDGGRPGGIALDGGKQDRDGGIALD